jgi:1-acyl-sn-glycerol-3-phosphate acyltransferase
MARLRAALAALYVVASTAIVAPLVIVCVGLRASRRVVPLLERGWARSILCVAGVRVSVEREAAAAAPPCLLLCNHQSNLDAICLAPHLPAGTIFVAKKSLRRVPLLGWAMWAAGFVFIDRRDRRSAAASLQHAADRVRGGTPLLIFPEGTRSPDGRLLPFKRGAFHVAVAARVPIVPIAISGTGSLMPPGHLGIAAGPVRLRFGAPIAVDESATIDAVAAQAERAISGLLERARAAPDPAGD